MSVPTAPSQPDFAPVLPVMIRTLAARHGDRELIVGDERRLGYAEAEAISARMARALLEAGVGKGTRVGVCFPNGPDWVLAWLAAARIGAVVVPLNTFFKARELGWILRHADVSVLLTASRLLGNDYLERLEEIAPELAGATPGRLRARALPYLRSVYAWGGADRAWAGAGEALADGPADAALDGEFLRAVEACVTAADPMVILYSSGSTADPKGAVHSHGGVIRHAYQLGRLRGVRPGDRMWSPMPFFWVGGFVFALLGGMHAGACLLTESSFEPGRTLALLERERATAAVGWPHFGKALVEHPDFATRDLSSLRAGNIPKLLPPEVCSPDPELRPNGLGMTETLGPHTYTGEGSLPESLRGAFGTALAGVEHRVVDPETGAVLGAGKAGEICVRGYSLMQGLYKIEREQSFDRDGFYHTGDGGFFDANGVLFFQGRLGDMIKSGGANVTPSEVESVLLALPEVKEAYVVGVADAQRGENVAAAVVLEPGAALAPAELRARAKAQLAAYKVPRHVLVCERAALPFTDTGKIDKRRLRVALEARVAAGDI
jgi:acyl-CoA synthetase (AMP-forming)/AMP-acid ligase II